jgi:hypothetical protein
MPHRQPNSEPSGARIGTPAKAPIGRLPPRRAGAYASTSATTGATLGPRPSTIARTGSSSSASSRSRSMP